jgi:hypothetical protein
MVRKSVLLILGLTSFAFGDTGVTSTIKLLDRSVPVSCVVGQINVSPGSLSCSGQTATLSTVSGTTLVAGTGISISCTNGICTITNTGGGGGTKYVLMEDASIILAEDGSKILTEN